MTMLPLNLFYLVVIYFICQIYIHLSDSQLNLFVKLLEYAQKEQKDWTPVTESLISSVKYNEDNELFKKFDELNEKDKWKLL